jgi:hypothetical protein
MPAGAPYGNKNAEKWSKELNLRNEFKNEKEYQHGVGEFVDTALEGGACRRVEYELLGHLFSP